MRIITLYTAVTASTNAAITYQWISKSRLDTIFASVYQNAAAGGPTNSVFEFSLQSTSQIGTNDPIGVLMTVRATTQALSTSSVSNSLITPIGFQWQPVDRLYVNVSIGVALTASAAHFTLFCDT